MLELQRITCTDMCCSDVALGKIEIHQVVYVLPDNHVRIHENDPLRFRITMDITAWMSFEEARNSERTSYSVNSKTLGQGRDIRISPIVSVECNIKIQRVISHLNFVHVSTNRASNSSRTWVCLRERGWTSRKRIPCFRRIRLDSGSKRGGIMATIGYLVLTTFIP